ncbi:MAG: FtsQ-type POTRA domain-containing protein, partial [Clostridia bacterium]|nr:FtsQ-type POTRA domain-containing protein [Clostridia bacterium]
SKCSHLTEQHVITASGMSNNQSVFTMNRQRYIDKIEKSEEYLKVLSLEVVWPNSLKIHLMEREDVYCIPMIDNTYLITDSEFKVLRKIFAGSNTMPDNCIVIQGREGYNSGTYEVGDFLPTQYFADYLPLQDAFFANDQDLVSMQALIESASIVDNTLSLQTYSGVTIDILNAGYYTDTKVRTALGILSSLSASELNSGSIYVFKNEYSIIEGRYIV